MLPTRSFDLGSWTYGVARRAYSDDWAAYGREATKRMDLRPLFRRKPEGRPVHVRKRRAAGRYWLGRGAGNAAIVGPGADPCRFVIEWRARFEDLRKRAGAAGATGTVGRIRSRLRRGVWTVAMA